MDESAPKAPIQPSIDTVRPEQTATKENEKPHGPQLPLSEIPPSKRNKSDAEHPRDQIPRWKILMEIAAIIIGIVVAIIYGQQLVVMRGQLDEMSAARRPWVGPVGDLKMTRPPAFWADERIDWPPEFAKANPEIASTPPLRYVEVYVSWAIQNFGNSPARRVTHTLLAYVSNDANNPPAEVRNMACTVGNQMVANPNVNATVLFPGNVIPIPPSNSISAVPRDMADILGVWLVGCVTYEDTSGNIHHTKILWASYLPDSRKREVALENMRLTWVPFQSFRLVESDVDD